MIKKILLFILSLFCLVLFIVLMFNNETNVIDIKLLESDWIPVVSIMGILVSMFYTFINLFSLFPPEKRKNNEKICA
ncbi:MAG: hypothetical protein O210_OD1C00001G0190 [Parcubacteria bacterium RAAC4_OD1_1]|nr:MAG: hypothetical protein O210_OD1C00001G0190 [Parcubacteria bacterium RAAC4_OD1_1]